MITIKFWKDVILELYTDPIDGMFGVLGTIITVPLDIVLFPIEIITFIIYKILERKYNIWQKNKQ